MDKREQLLDIMKEALTTKDEKIQALNDECQQSMLDIARERDRAERAEAGERAAHDAANTAIRQRDEARAQLAEARKALEKIYIEARSLPLHTSAVTREYVLTSKLAVIRDAVRRALTGGKNNHVR